MASDDKAVEVFPGADERTPSRAQYFSWINNTNEGATEAQTLANLAFFRWLGEEYGMVLDIYAFDAGAIDGAKYYGAMDSERFKRQFPRGFGPSAEAAREIGCRLGLWGGPDGFGDTPEQQRARIDMIVSLCRDHGFMLFKLDAVCGQLRSDKQPAFVEQMTACRKYCPDLIVLNHRLELGLGMPHATTFLWGGDETYTDVHMVNRKCATHNRARALDRGLVPGLQRLTEDHGVCLSSCLDYWDDELILQAFNRCLILAPEIYGNPWLLRDDEFPRLARIYNLHRRFRDILVDGMVLPDALGPNAVSRGDGDTRFVTLCNLTWEPVRYSLMLDDSIGLSGDGEVELRRLHPHERILGRYAPGQTVEVEVLPFRACLVMATRRPNPEIGVEGCDYDVACDVPGRPVKITLLAPAGATAQVRLRPGERTFSGATLDGERVDGLADGQSVPVAFEGEPLAEAWHRKLGDLTAVEVPDDAEALYEATCFAADNNALEVRELERSGPTAIAEVAGAREAFFSQPTFRRRLVWDRYLFDDDPNTGLAVSRRYRPMRIRGGGFRLDLGQPTLIDHLHLAVGGDYELQPIKSQEGVWAAVSADLKTWTPVRFFATEDLAAELPAESPIRYIRMDGCPDKITEVRGSFRGRPLDRSGWRASNLFGRYRSAPATHAWSLKFKLDQAAPGAYLAIACHGKHGAEAAYAALRVGDGYAGSPRRSPSYPANSWEGTVAQTDGNTTYYIPITAEMIGKPLEAVVLLLKGGLSDIQVEAWLTAYPVPMTKKELVLTD